MQVLLQTKNAAQHDLLVVPVFQNESPLACTALISHLEGALLRACGECDFTGAAAQQVIVEAKTPASRIALLGLGPRSAAKAATLWHFGGTATRLADKFGAQTVCLVVPNYAPPAGDAPALIARGAQLGLYRFEQFKSKKSRPSQLKTITLHQESPGESIFNAAHTQIVSDAVSLVRDLVNMPAGQQSPHQLAQQAVLLAQDVSLEAHVFAAPQLDKMGMQLLVAVGAGSSRQPNLVHLKYTPAKSAATRTVALVGKGITFDSGGLCLKTRPGMLDMKLDMAGAATVLATMLAVARLHPTVCVHGVLALAENMPSGDAYRPGDIITGAQGRSVEITNTDAEGRLILADALHFAAAQSPDTIIDVATLTGACVVALGPQTVGLFANNEALAADLQAASARTGEDFWRLPLTASLDSELKSEVADMRNAGNPLHGGAITAALFLQKFVGDIPWAHLDICGPAFCYEESGAITKGGTGIAVATLVDYLIHQSGPEKPCSGA